MGSRSESVRRSWDRRRALWRVSPGEFVELQKLGTISDSLKRAAVLAQEEGLALVSALGGFDNVSEQRMVLIQDTVRLGLVLRAVVARFLQGDGDADLATKVGTLASARRASLQALGLERVAKELDLSTYLAQKSADKSSETHETPLSGTNYSEPDSVDPEAEQAAAGPNGGSAPERDVVHLDSADASTSTNTQED